MSDSQDTTFSESKYPDHHAPNYEQAARFLATIAGSHPIYLVGIKPDERSVAVHGIAGNDRVQLNATVRSFDPVNAFYCPNIGERNLTTPPPLSSISAIRAFVVDIDPLPSTSIDGFAAERLRLKKKIHDILVNTPLKPTYAVDTGNGCQLVYLLDVPLPINDRRDRITDTHRILVSALEGDITTATINHLFRIPGTQNHPTQAKRDRGATTCWSGLWLDNGRLWTYNDLNDEARRYADMLGRGPDEATHEESDIHGIREGDLYYAYESGLNNFRDARDKVSQAMNDEAFAALKARLNQPPDRSKTDFMFCCWLFRGGATERQVALALAALGAGKAHPINTRRWYRYIASTVLRAKAKVSERPDDRFYEEDIEPQQEEKPREAPGRRRFKLWEEICDHPPRGDAALVEHMLPRRGVSMLYGPSNSGKSLAALAVAAHVTVGERICGRDIFAKPNAIAVYVAMEGGGGLDRRVHAMQRQFPDRHPKVIAITEPFTLRSRYRPEDKDETRDLIGIIEEARQGLPVSLVVIDMLTHAASGADENAARDMSDVFRQLERIEQAFSTHVMVLHHTGKNEARGARGWSGMRGRVDTELELVPLGNGGDIVVTKQRDMEITRRPFSFAIRTQYLGASEQTGKPIIGALALFDIIDPQEADYQPTEIEQELHDIIGRLGRDGATARDIAKAMQVPVTMLVLRARLDRMVKRHLIFKRAGIGRTTGEDTRYFIADYEPYETFNDPFS